MKTDNLNSRPFISSTPYVMYFVSESMAPFVGFGRDGYNRCKAATKKAPGTVLDVGVTIEGINARVKHWVQVINNTENQWLYKKYGVLENTLVFCAPNGDVLGAFRADASNRTAVEQFVLNFDVTYRMYCDAKEKREKALLEKNQEKNAVKVAGSKVPLVAKDEAKLQSLLALQSRETVKKMPVITDE